MAEAYLVQIDLDKLRADLSQAETQPLTEEQVMGWLQEIGCQPTVGGWIAGHATMKMLKPTEIIMAEPFA